MPVCATPPAPVIRLTLVGTGEMLLRMEKRLSCAAAGLGVRLDMAIRKDANAMGISYPQTPAVLHEGKVIFNGLHRTEEIEVWLKNLVNRGEQDEKHQGIGNRLRELQDDTQTDRSGSKK